jgi:mRNA-degrading endonuclease toxin of MazEF toxin-antitoxin module
VVQLVQVCGREIGAQRAVVAGDDDAAAARGSLLVVAVLGADARFGADVLEDLAVLVLANAADVDGGVGGEDVLCKGHILALAAFSR